MISQIIFETAPYSNQVESLSSFFAQTAFGILLSPASAYPMNTANYIPKWN